MSTSEEIHKETARHIDTSQLKINRDIDFAITTAWNGETDHFTLLSNGEIQYPSA